MIPTKMTISQKQLYFNAFSNGVVPKGIDKEWVIGRENEFKALEFMLEEAINYNISSFKLLEGTYGSGKSTILCAFEQEALNKGFVVSRFPLGSHNNFSKPEIIYRDIMNHLAISSHSGASEFETIFDLWLKEIKSDGNASNESNASKKIFNVIQELQKYHPSFANVLLVYIRGRINNDNELSSLAASWIKGDYNIPIEEKRKLNIKGSIDRHNAFDILRGFSKLVQLLGYNGLVIIVDELEYILRERVDIRNRGYTTMRHLVDEIGENSWVNTVFVGAQTPDMMNNKEKGYQSYEALYQRITSGFDDNGRIDDFSGLTTIPLRALKEEDFLEIGAKIARLQSLLVDPNHLAMLAHIELRKRENIEEKSSVAREYIKIVIHMIELAKANPNMPIFHVNK